MYEIILLERENEIWMENNIIGNMLQSYWDFFRIKKIIFFFFSLYFVTDFICFEWRFSFFDSFSVSIQIQWQQFHNYYTEERRRRRRFFVKICCFRLNFNEIFCICVLFSSDLLCTFNITYVREIPKLSKAANEPTSNYS